MFIPNSLQELVIPEVVRTREEGRYPILVYAKALHFLYLNVLY